MPHPRYATISLLVLAACGGNSAPADSSQGNAATLANEITVKDDVAERVIAAFGAVDALDAAMGGRAGVEVSSLTCVTASNAALDATDPMSNVPTTTCGFDVAGRTPARVEVTDPAAKANVLYDALDAAGAMADAAMGKSYVTAKHVVCTGQRNVEDPGAIPTASCDLSLDDGTTKTVTDDKARRLLQAFGMMDVGDSAMGGRFGCDVTGVQCEERSNESLDEKDPQFGVPAYACKMDDAERSPSAVSVEDAQAKAVALLAALEKAGLAADSAMGKSGVTASRVSCTKGPGEPTTCTLARD